MIDESTLSVQWDGQGYSILVPQSLIGATLYYSQSPEGSLEPLCALTERETCISSPCPGSRLYFAVPSQGDAPLRFASRAVEVSAVQNFRDLGGYPTKEGKRVKWGRFFRSGVVKGINDREQDVFAGLGLQMVLDYRSKDEITRHPDSFPGEAAYVWVSALPGREDFNQLADGDMISRLRLVDSDADVEAAFTLFSEFYEALPFHNPAYQRMFSALDQKSGVPLLQHCSAGKDRTGIGCALLLLALGVSPETAVEDYLLSAAFRAEANQRRVAKLLSEGISQPAEKLIRMMMTVSPSLIQGAFKAILERYASFETFFQEEYGITQARLTHWRSLHTQ